MEVGIKKNTKTTARLLNANLNANRGIVSQHYELKAMNTVKLCIQIMLHTHIFPFATAVIILGFW